MGRDSEQDKGHSSDESPDRKGNKFSNEDDELFKVGQKRSSHSDSERKSSPSRKKTNFTLFIGNLPFSTTESQLSDFFSDNNCDFVSVRLTKDQSTNKSRGFGYADFANEDDMKKAIRLNGSDLGGRDVKIDYAAQKDNIEESTTIYVGNLSFDTYEDSIKKFLEDNQCSNVREIRLIKDENGNSKGFAYIEFDDIPSAAAVIELNNSDLDGRSLRINFENKKRRGGGGGGFGGRGGGRGFDRDRRGGGGGYDRDRRGGDRGYDRDRRSGGGGGYDRDRRGGGGGGGYDRDRRGGDRGYDRDRRSGGSGGYDRDRRGGDRGYDRDRRGGGGGYDRDRSDRYDRRN